MVDLPNDGSKGVLSASTNERSPVGASGEIEIAAAPEVVWDILTDFDRWPDWNPEVRWMSMTGPAAVGSTSP